MRVLFVSDFFWPLIGGIEVWAARLVTRMAARGYEVRVVTSRFEEERPPPDRLGDVAIERFDFRAAVEDGRLDRFGEALTGMKRVKREFRPDVVHLGTVGWSTLFHLLSRDAWNAPTLLTLTQQRLASQDGADDTLLGRALGSVDWVSSVSAAVLDQAIELAPPVAGRSSVDYWGMEAPFEPAPPGLDPPRVLCVGRLVPAKGFDLVLRALAALVEAHPALSLAIAGEGPERSRLEALATELEVAGRVSFEGWIDPRAVPARMAEASLVALPSHREGLPVVAVEAAWSGRPIVGANVSGMREVVDHGRTGLLVPAGDRDALARAIDEIVRDPAGARRMGLEARRLAVRRFSLDGMLDAYESLYERLAKRRMDARV
ncbi:MAG TPA: glycosyltransferase family 4 protein [Gemmatimonadota bacterium]|nr:glycosyltransferase family 4 protein [Gemmatimonadota bacterium]